MSPASTIDPVERRAAKRLERLAARADTAIADRDKAICEASAAGVSVREIAKIVGVSHGKVHQIITTARTADEAAVTPDDGQVPL